MTKQRIPLADRTKEVTNRQVRGVSSLAKGLFKKSTRKTKNNTEKLNSFFKSFSSQPPQHKVPRAVHLSDHLQSKSISQRTGSVIQRLNYTHNATSQRQVQVYSDHSAISRDEIGPLSSHMMKKLGEISTISTILRYDQPVKAFRDIPLSQDTEVVVDVQSLSPTFQLVQLVDQSTAGILSFQPTLVRIRTGDRLVLGDDHVIVDLGNGPVPCYYRWYKILGVY